MNLILASQSPRRKTLLEQFGLKFSVEVLPTNEVEQGDPYAVAEENARAKALPVSANQTQAIVLGADTIVVLDGQILGKPKTVEEARKMLSCLSGRIHDVTTVVVFCQGGQVLRIHRETTMVEFRELKPFEIEAYLATGEPFDKAGGYGIQGFGGLLVKSIKGCYYNVVGLPVPNLVEVLRDLGIELFTIR